MFVAMHLSFAASRKEPLSEMAGRVRQAFLDAGLGEPIIRFTFTNSSGLGGVSSIDRVLKRHPEMERFVTGTEEARLLSNAETGEAAEYSTLQAIAAGVPRSYPFGGAALHFYAPAFGERLIGLPKAGHSLPGVLVTDSWWVSGRQRALSAYTVVEAEEDDKKLPPNPKPVDGVIKSLGKVRRTQQVPILVSIPPANAQAVKPIVADYRARMKEIVEKAGLPHDLPPAAEVRSQLLGVLAGPRKPALEAAFKPMGYSCRGGSGEFHLTRRTSGNLTVELYLDVGTWSHQATPIFLVQGSGFKASLVLWVAPRAQGGQYPIGDAAHWQKIVDNLAAMVRELDRSFVPDIERAAGPTPAWYQPPD